MKETLVALYAWHSKDEEVLSVAPLGPANENALNRIEELNFRPLWQRSVRTCGCFPLSNAGHLIPMLFNELLLLVKTRLNQLLVPLSLPFCELIGLIEASYSNLARVCPLFKSTI